MEIRVKPDPRFQRDGSHLICQVEVPYITAILGGEIEVPTLQGTAKLTIPKGCQFGEQLRLSGEGLPSLRGSRRGDLICIAQVKIPKKISKDEERLLREIARIRGENSPKEKSGFFGF